MAMSNSSSIRCGLRAPCHGTCGTLIGIDIYPNQIEAYSLLTFISLLDILITIFRFLSNDDTLEHLIEKNFLTMANTTASLNPTNSMTKDPHKFSKVYHPMIKVTWKKLGHPNALRRENELLGNI